MRIIKVDAKTNIEDVACEACVVLARGGIVIYPTETCYGIGVDALNQTAVDKLLSYKRRREGKPLSVLVHDKTEACKYVMVNETAERIYDQLLPGPVTVVSLVNSAELAGGVASELGTLGIRISSHPLAMALSKTYRKPITATSANASWKKKPYSIDDVLSPLSVQQKGKIDLILDYGVLPKRESSTVVDTTLVGGMIMRAGDLQIAGVACEYQTSTPEETRNLAKRLILKEWNKVRKHGLVCALTGDLGVGKTVFAQGVGEFLGIKQPLVSPSFTLVNEYDFLRHGVSGKLYHLDPWRLSNFEELLGLGFAEMLVANNIVIIEWANKFREALTEHCQLNKIPMAVVIFQDLGEDRRLLKVV